MGALGAILFDGISHAQAIVEFESQDAFARRNPGEIKTFVAMEIFADCVGKSPYHTEVI